MVLRSDASPSSSHSFAPCQSPVPGPYWLIPGWFLTLSLISKYVCFSHWTPHCQCKQLAGETAINCFLVAFFVSWEQPLVCFKVLVLCPGSLLGQMFPLISTLPEARQLWHFRDAGLYLTQKCILQVEAAMWKSAAQASFRSLGAESGWCGEATWKSLEDHSSFKSRGLPVAWY